MTRTYHWMVVGLAVMLAPGLGCGGGGSAADPVAEAVAQYKAAVEPPIQKSEAIAKTFVEIVLANKGNPDPDQAAQRIESEIIPRAKTFLEEVTAIQPENEKVAAIHKFLVQVAQLRLEGYTDLVKGYKENDLDLFNQGRKKITESKIQENAFIEQASQLMGSYGYKLEYYAPPTADAVLP